MPDTEQEQFLLEGFDVETGFLRLLSLLPLSQKQEENKAPYLYLICWVQTLVSHSTETAPYLSFTLSQAGWHLGISCALFPKSSLRGFRVKQTH